MQSCTKLRPRDRFLNSHIRPPGCEKRHGGPNGRITSNGPVDGLTESNGDWFVRFFLSLSTSLDHYQVVFETDILALTYRHTNRLGEPFSSQTALSYGLVHSIVPQEKVVEEAIEVAKKIAGMSPDSVIVTRHGIREGWNGGSCMHFRVCLFQQTYLDLVLVIFDANVFYLAKISGRSNRADIG